MSTSASAARLGAMRSSRRLRATMRVLVGAGVLVAVVSQVGSAPFLRALSSINVPVIAAALALSAGATVAAAWRWSVIAGRLGVGLRFPEAVASYYRSQFVNTLLPGGVAGDVERAVAQAHSTGNVAQAARAVIIERTVGQAVQVALAVIVIAFAAGEFAGALLPALGVGLAALALAALVAAANARSRAMLRRELDELAAGVGSFGAFVRVVVASIAVVGCHVATLGLAAAAVGARVSPLRLAAIALVVLLAASIPASIGGWGPREGVAGWAFAVAGLGASAGVAASALFGVLAMVGVAPALVIAVISALRRAPAARRHVPTSAPACTVR